MNINLISSNNINDATARIIDAVRKRSQSGAHRELVNPLFIIVPDRFTLQCERILLSNPACLLNVRVLTFSMLFNLIYEELGETDRQILDKSSSVLLMWKAVQSCADELIWFNTAVGHYNFAEKMFNTVNQLSSSMADFEKLEKNARNEITRKKMHDISLIYKSYKELIASHLSLDAGGMLGWLIENAHKSTIIKSADIFVTGFEYLSVQRGAVLCELLRIASSFTAGYRMNSEFESFINKACFDLGARADVKTVTYKNISTAEVVACDSIQDEAISVANKICVLTKRGGVRFRNITVVLCDYENTVKIYEQVFAENGIAANVDIGEDLLANPLTQFVKHLLGAGLPESVVLLINNPYSGLGAEQQFALENFCIKYNASASYLKKVKNQQGELADAIAAFNVSIGTYIGRLAKARTVGVICEILEQVLVELKLPTTVPSEMKQEVARAKLGQLLEICKQILYGQQMSLQEFSNMFCTLASAAKISTIPAYADRVSLVNADDYEPSFAPYLFIAGARAGAFPIEQDDTDIITEFDIANMSVKIEPTATMQNARARTRALNILSSCTDRLFVSYSAFDSKGGEAQASDVIGKLGAVQPVQTATQEQIACKSYAQKELIRAVDEGSAFLDPIYYNSILKALDAAEIKIPNLGAKPERVERARELFFTNNTARVTQFENFYKCPYYHFLQNGLKVKPRERYQIAANMIGSLIHKIVELFLNKVIKCSKNNLPKDKQLDETICEITNMVLALDEFSFFANDPVNKPIVSVLKKETKRIANLLIAHIESGEYFPAFTEQELSATVGGVTCRGIADRIDTAMLDGRTHAVIIDYKTGGAVNFSYKDLYLGTKLQLPLYMNFLPDRYQAGGAYYLNLRGGFKKQSTESILSGIALDTPENSNALGDAVGAISRSQFSAVAAYALLITEKAVEKITNGYIDPSPNQPKSCGYCPAACSCAFKDGKRGLSPHDRVSAKTIETLMQSGIKRGQYD